MLIPKATRTKVYSYLFQGEIPSPDRTHRSGVQVAMAGRLADRVFLVWITQARALSRGGGSGWGGGSGGRVEAGRMHAEVHHMV